VTVVTGRKLEPRAVATAEPVLEHYEFDAGLQKIKTGPLGEGAGNANLSFQGSPRAILRYVIPQIGSGGLLSADRVRFVFQQIHIGRRLILLAILGLWGTYNGPKLSLFPSGPLGHTVSYSLNEIPVLLTSLIIQISFHRHLYSPPAFALSH
jgi:hypothetical protein